MAGRRGLFKQRVVRARSGWSCAATSVSTVFHYWRDSALARGVYWTGSFVSEYYRLAKNRSHWTVSLEMRWSSSSACLPPCLECSIDSRRRRSPVEPGIANGPDQHWRTWCGSATYTVHRRARVRPGPLERNWQAVSEKSKWAVSGANQRHAWLGCTRCAEPKPDLRLWGNHGSGSGWATERPTTGRSIQARSLPFRDSSYPRLLHTDWRGADIGKEKSITAERSRHTAPTLLQSDDKPRPRQATYWVGTTNLCGFFDCNSALVNGRLEIVGCHAAVREFAARLMVPQFASERWLLSIPLLGAGACRVCCVLS